MDIRYSFLAAFSSTFIAINAYAGDISPEAVIDAQVTWGDGIVAIAKAHSEGADYAARATEHIEALYGPCCTDLSMV